MTNGGKVSLMIGMVVLGLSPSFIDWQENTERRWQILAYYAVALGLIAAGLWDGG